MFGIKFSKKLETSATKTFTNVLMKHHAPVALIKLWEKGGRRVCAQTF